MTSTPISLYLDLEPGKVADIEVVARAALAFSAAVKDLAYVIDPSMELRIELASGTEGSLSLNSFLKNLRAKPGETLTLSAIAVVVLSWFGNNLLDWTFDQAMDLAKEAVGIHEKAEGFTPAQREELKQIFESAQAGKVAAPLVQRVYREIERDPAIRGVGATTVPGARPANIVPRSQFRDRGGQAKPVEQTISRRLTSQQQRVELISPVLIPGNRRWKLRTGQGEFGAAIKDQDFVNSVLLGTTSVRMKTGIEMMVELETVEEFKNGVWEVIERNVTEVYRLIEPPQQGDLLLPKSDDQEPDDDDR